MTLLEKARSLSSSEKTKVSLILSAVLTAAIVLVWYMALRVPPKDSAIKENSTAQSLKPLFMIFQGAKEEMGEIKEGIKTYKQKRDEARVLE